MAPSCLCPRCSPGERAQFDLQVLAGKRGSWAEMDGRAAPSRWKRSTCHLDGHGGSFCLSEWQADHVSCLEITCVLPLHGVCCTPTIVHLPPHPARGTSCLVAVPPRDIAAGGATVRKDNVHEAAGHWPMAVAFECVRAWTEINCYYYLITN